MNRREGGVFMEMLSEWIIPLGEFGFPALIAFYLLFRFEKRIDNLTGAIRELEQSAQKIK